MNRLSGEIPPELGRLSRLTTLALDSNRLSGGIPPEFGSLSNLATLRLGGNQLTGGIPPELGGLSNLESLSLTDNRLGGKIPPELGNLSNLNSFSLGGNDQFTGCLPTGLKNASRSRATGSDFASIGLPFCNPDGSEPVAGPTDTGETTPATASETPQMGFSWAQDGLTDREQRVLSYLQELAADHPPVAEDIMEFPWLESGVASPEGSAITSILRIARADGSLAQRVVEFPWLADSVHPNEAAILYQIARLSEVDPAQALHLVESPWLESRVSYLHVEVLTNLAALAVDPDWHPTRKDVIGPALSQRWYEDGLSTEEAARIMALVGFFQPSSPGFREFIQNSRARSETFSLPQLDANMFVVSRSSLGPIEDSVLDGLRTGIEAHRDFMDWWPKPDVILLVEPLSPGAGESKFAPGIALIRVSSGNDQSTVNHELCHGYFPLAPVGIGPHWLVEGTCEFLAAHALHIAENASLQSRHNWVRERVSSRCAPQGLTKARDMSELDRSEVSDEVDSCFYRIGESFLHGMHNALGIDVVSFSLHELYLMYALGYTLTETDIYQAFLWNTPPEKQDEFRGLYQELHGGPTDETAPRIHGGGHIANVLASLAGNLQWAAYFDNGTKQWSVYDPNGSFSKDSLLMLTPPGRPPPDLSSIGVLTHLVPGRIYWMAMREDQTVALGNNTYALSEGITPIYLSGIPCLRESVSQCNLWNR